MKKEIVAITGADGFIGSHLVEHLLQSSQVHVRALIWYNAFGHQGWLDQVISRLSSSERQRVEIEVGDIRDAAAMRRFLSGADRVIHLAALIAIPYSYQAAESYVDTNIRGTLNLLEGARLTQVSRFVQVSSSEVYGSAHVVPMTEEHPLSAQSPYAASKIAADQLALSYWHAHQLPVTVVRPFNTFGPRQSVRAIVPTIIVQALAGPEIKLGRIDVTRDLTFVTDTVRGLVIASDPNRSVNGQTIQLGTGQEYRIDEMVANIGEILNKKLSITTDQTRLRPSNSEVTRLLADFTKAGGLLDWRPEVNFKDGLATTIEWFRDESIRNRFHTESYRL